MCLSVDILLLALFVHAENVVLPLRICAGYSYSDVGDDVGIALGYALSDGVHEYASVRFIIAAVS